MLYSREAVARDLYQRGARTALCNTTVVGDTVALLKDIGFTVVSMIHELPHLEKRGTYELFRLFTVAHLSNDKSIYFGAKFNEDLLKTLRISQFSMWYTHMTWRSA